MAAAADCWPDLDPFREIARSGARLIRLTGSDIAHCFDEIAGKTPAHVGYEPFAASLLLRLRFGALSASILLVLFLGQVAIALLTQHDEAMTISWLTDFAWVYLASTVMLMPRSYDALAVAFRGVLRFARSKD